MTEFHAQLRERAHDAVRSLVDAQRDGDDYSVEVYLADLENIARIAGEHGVDLPELEGLELPAA